MGSGNPTILTMAAVLVNGVGAVNTAGAIVPPPGNYRVSCDSLVEFGSSANTEITTQILWKGAALGATAGIAGYAQAVYATAVNTLVPQSVNAYIACDGVGAIQVQMTPTYSGGGNPTLWGNLTLTAV